MNLWINGHPCTPELPGRATLADLVESLGLKPDRVAIERNGEIASRGDWAETLLTQEDRIEIVQFVGGGRE